MSPQVGTTTIPGVVPNHTATRISPNMQAIFSTSSTAPWKILNANDLACLEFGVNEQEIKRGVSILDFFENGRREWVEERLTGSTLSKSDVISLGEDSSNDSTKAESGEGDVVAKEEWKERVVLCGEVVNMRKLKESGNSKRASVTASLWVKEKVFTLNCWC